MNDFIKLKENDKVKVLMFFVYNLKIIGGTMQRLKKYSIFAIFFITLLLYGCQVIQVSGRTFRYDSVSIDWGMADKEGKEKVFEEFQVQSEAELLSVLKTRNGRDKRYTTFGTNNQYTTKNDQNEILDSGYYKQDETVITLADTEEGLKEPGAYTLQANDKGYIVTVKINNDYKVFAKYQYKEQE